MSGILNLQLTTEQAVTFQVLHSERRLREFEMILDSPNFLQSRGRHYMSGSVGLNAMQQVN